jgi:hypothetical protein
MSALRCVEASAANGASLHKELRCRNFRGVGARGAQAGTAPCKTGLIHAVRNMKVVLVGIVGAAFLAGCNQQQVPPEKQQAVQQDTQRQSAAPTPAPAPLNDPNLMRGSSAPAPVQKKREPKGQFQAPAPLNNPNLLRGG